MSTKCMLFFMKINYFSTFIAIFVGNNNNFSVTDLKMTSFLDFSRIRYLDHIVSSSLTAQRPFPLPTHSTSHFLSKIKQTNKIKTK